MRFNSVYLFSIFRYLTIIFVTVLITSCSTSPQINILSQKSSSNFVLDNANLLSNEQSAELEILLSSQNHSGFGQINIIIIPQLPPNTSIESYALATIQAKLAAYESLPDQVVVIFAMKNQLMRIQTSGVVQQTLPDDICKQIIDEIMVPAFKQVHYFYGIKSGIDAIMERLKISTTSA